MRKELESKLNELNKKIGSEKIKTGDKFSIERIPSGSLGLDVAIGGGLPAGRFVLLWGGTGSGKSTLSMLGVANAQAMGKTCMWIDTEGHYDKEWAEACGANPSELIVHQLKEVEIIIETTTELIKDDLVDMVVIDSINGLNYTKYYEENNNSLGMHSRAINDLCNKLNYFNNNTLFVLISQVRTKMAKFGGYASYSGGNGIGHWASLIVRINNPKDFLNEEKDDKWIDWEVTDSNISVPYRTGRYVLMAGGGIDTMNEAISIGVKANILKKSGNWLSVEGQTEKFNGMAAFKEYLIENPDVYRELKDEISQRYAKQG